MAFPIPAAGKAGAWVQGSFGRTRRYSRRRRFVPKHGFWSPVHLGGSGLSGNVGYPNIDWAQGHFDSSNAGSLPVLAISPQPVQYQDTAPAEQYAEVGHTRRMMLRKLAGDLVLGVTDFNLNDGGYLPYITYTWKKISRPFVGNTTDGGIDLNDLVSFMVDEGSTPGSSISKPRSKDNRYRSDIVRQGALINLSNNQWDAGTLYGGCRMLKVPYPRRPNMLLDSQESFLMLFLRVSPFWPGPVNVFPENGDFNVVLRSDTFKAYWEPV